MTEKSCKCNCQNDPKPKGWAPGTILRAKDPADRGIYILNANGTWTTHHIGLGSLDKPVTWTGEVIDDYMTEDYCIVLYDASKEPQR